MAKGYYEDNETTVTASKREPKSLPDGTLNVNMSADEYGAFLKLLDEEKILAAKKEEAKKLSEAKWSIYNEIEKMKNSVREKMDKVDKQIKELEAERNRLYYESHSNLFSFYKNKKVRDIEKKIDLLWKGWINLNKKHTSFVEACVLVSNIDRK